jgi:PAS domain S-box-containing protein
VKPQPGLDTLREALRWTRESIFFMRNDSLEVEWANEAACHHLGLTPQGIAGTPCHRLLAGRNEACPDCPVRASLRTRTVRSAECRGAHGQTWHVRSVPVLDDSDRLQGGLLYADSSPREDELARRLAESEARYNALFTDNHAAILLTDPDTGIIVEGNDAACAYYGYTAQELAGLPIHAINTLSPDQIKVRMEAAVVEGRRRYEFQHRLADGQIRDVEVYSGPIRYGERQLLYSIIHDITERRRAEVDLQKSLAEKEVLLREVHHRLKNNLSVVNSLLHWQAEAVEDQLARRILEQTVSRVHSIALIHESLYSSDNLSKIEIRPYLEKLLSHMRYAVAVPGGTVDVETDIQDLSLGIDSAKACGLIVVELFMNAAKHAFPNARGGMISVAFRAMDDQRCCLSVRDNGVGLPEDVDFSQKEGRLGSSLIWVLVQELGGELDVERASGTAVHVVFPA